MNEKDRKEFILILQQYKLKLSRNKKASRQFLVDTGIVTKKGNLRAPYKHLCMIKNTRDYANDPTFLKRAEEASEFLQRVGLPESFIKK
jgi:hypothetical protein